MDWTTILRGQQVDFIERLKSGYLLHCDKEGQHSELTVISGARLEKLTDFCWEMAEKYKTTSSVRHVFINNIKGKLGEEVVKARLTDLVTEVDYEQRIGGDGKVDFNLTSVPSVGIQVKARHGNIDTVKWSITQEENEKNTVLICILIIEEVTGNKSAYNLILAGFLPTNMMTVADGKASIAINELLYCGGLQTYLESFNLWQPDYYIQMGNNCCIREDYQGAITNYSQALQVNPQNAKVYFLRADTYHHLGNFQAAINDYSQAIYINPKDAYSYNNRGLIYYELGYANYAINDYDEAVKINPKDAVVYLNLALAYYELDEMDESYIRTHSITLNYLNQALNINSEFYKAYYVRGKVRCQIGDLIGGFEDFNKVLKKYPDSALNIYTYLAEFYYYRGNYYSEIGNNKNALENLNLAANIYERLNNELSYKHTINYIHYIQSKYYDFEEANKYSQLIFTSNSKSLKVNDVDLKSLVGMNYTRLRDLLAAGKWKEADKETARVMLAVAKREKDFWLDVKDIDKFPCEDLRTIDQLWVKYSNGRFGFSVQKRIYQSLRGTKKYNEKIWQVFGNIVGWRKEGKWLDSEEITFDIKSPEAHLPYGRCVLKDIGFNWFWCGFLLSRRDL